MTTARTLYVDLLKNSLLGKILDPRRGNPIVTTEQCIALIQKANEIFKPYLAPLNHSVETYSLSEAADGNHAKGLCAALNYIHRDITPDTMSERSTVENLQFCIEEVIKNKIPGDFIETGVWKGGLTVFMRGVLKSYDINDRVVWVADSFNGLPEADPEINLKDAIWSVLLEPLERLKIPLDFVQNTFRKYDLLDDQVKFLEGWFSDTLAKAPIERLAILRLDGDWYESTMTSLNALYSKLSPGGFAIIDDYGLQIGCREAVDEFRERHGINEPITWVNHQTAFWKKCS